MKFDGAIILYMLYMISLPVNLHARARTAAVHDASPTSSVRCEKAKLFRHKGRVAWAEDISKSTVFFYVSGMAIDADGAPRAYHPSNRLGLDDLAHAGRPGNWWALATDTGETNGHPVLQRKGDPAPGYYVSMTSLYDATNPNERDPTRYVDASKIPYVVLPPVGFRHSRLGDFANVVNLKNGKMAAAIVADESAPELPLGEGSIALANALGIDPDPRYGGKDGGVAYVIYSHSGNGKPRSLEEIISNSNRQFQIWGGFDKLNECLATP